MEIKAGDVVVLKSGGPRMTVEGYESDLVNYDCLKGSVNHSSFIINF